MMDSPIHMFMRTTAAVLMSVLTMSEVRHHAYSWTIKPQSVYREISTQIQPELNLEPSESELLTKPDDTQRFGFVLELRYK